MPVSLFEGCVELFPFRANSRRKDTTIVPEIFSITITAYCFIAFICHWVGHEKKPSKIGIVGKDGPADKQAFLVGFFRMSNDLHIRRTRSTRRRQAEEVSYNDDPYSSFGRNGRNVNGTVVLWAHTHAHFNTYLSQKRKS